MSEQLRGNQENEHLPPLKDTCAYEECDKPYTMTPSNTAGRIYPKQRECNYLLSVCPHCQQAQRNFCVDEIMELAALHNIDIHDDEDYAEDDIYRAWCRVMEINLPKSYELTARHEQMIGHFATILAECPDEHLFDLITDTGYDQPYPQRWI